MNVLHRDSSICGRSVPPVSIADNSLSVYVLGLWHTIVSHPLKRRSHLQCNPFQLTFSFIRYNFKVYAKDYKNSYLLHLLQKLCRFASPGGKKSQKSKLRAGRWCLLLIKLASTIDDDRDRWERQSHKEPLQKKINKQRNQKHISIIVYRIKP